MNWLDPELSLPTQFDLERDRRAAAHLSRDDLAMQVDRMLIDWYRLREALHQASREIAGLQCKLALAEAPCTEGRNPPTADHHQWARELLTPPG